MDGVVVCSMAIAGMTAEWASGTCGAPARTGTEVPCRLEVRPLGTTIILENIHTARHLRWAGSTLKNIQAVDPFGRSPWDGGGSGFEYTAR